MIYLCMSVLDKQVGAYLPPFFVRTKGEAVRSFMDAVKDPKHQFARHPDDYVLFQCGEFEDGTGIFSSREPDRIISARECVDK